MSVPLAAGLADAVLDALPAEVAILDRVGRIIAVNAQWKRFAAENGMQWPAWGIGEEYAHISESVVDGCAEVGTDAAARIRAVLREEIDEASLEYPCHSPGVERWYRMSVRPWRAATAAGEQGGAIVMHIDISERRRAEVAALYAQTDAMIVVLDSHDRIESVNPAFTRATGWSSLDAVSRTAARWIHPLPADATSNLRAEQARRDGSSFMVEWSISPIHGADGQLRNHICIGRDVTRALQIEARLRENDKLRAVATLAAGIAHDFNNLLGSILGLGELCALDAREGSRQSQNLVRLLRAGRSAAALVRQMLDFSRQTPSTRKPMRIGELLEQVDPLLRTALPPNVRAVIRIAADAPVSVDVSRMEQVLLNLARNAAYAMRTVGGTVNILVDRHDPISIAKANNSESDHGPDEASHIRIRVIDSGEGIAQENLPRIFEPFFTTKPVGQGTGLGLAAVHGIIADHAGVVEVNSTQGSGTTFSIFLPVAPCNRDVSDGAAPAAADAAFLSTTLPIESP